MRSVLTPKDLTMGQPIQAGWYPLLISSVKEEVTKGNEKNPSDGSMNCIYEFTIDDGPEGVKGRKIKRFYNEKALGFGDSLWAVLFPGTYVKGKGGELNSDMFKSTEGSKVMGYVKMNGKYPDIEDFRPMGQVAK